ncbi:MAG: VanZ family protein [Candidatus Zophobacter franzmannii]|nr:VanZ family protein [Candidatus Zophobacter franzmannii]
MTKLRFTSVLFWLWMILIVTLSSWPSLKTSDTGILSLDKLLHFGKYGMAGLLLGLFLLRTNHSLKNIITKFAYLALFSIADEYHQFFISGRSVSIWDAIANLIGVFFALLFIIVIIKGIIFKKHLS